jgi:hypothetical protein
MIEMVASREVPVAYLEACDYSDFALGERLAQTDAARLAGDTTPGQARRNPSLRDNLDLDGICPELGNFVNRTNA